MNLCCMHLPYSMVISHADKFTSRKQLNIKIYTPESRLTQSCLKVANMKDSPRLIWLLLLVLFQPTFTGAACIVTRTTESRYDDYDEEYIDYYKYSIIQCTLTSLQMNVPLTSYISKYANEATEALSIDFSSSTINTVPVGVLQRFSAVTLLKMDNVYINSIEPGALRGLTQLEELNLSHNNISEIQDGTFDGLVQLRKLLMVGNKLTTLKSLNGLTNLQWLDVDGNNIVTIDDGAFKDTVNLKNLNLNRNKLVNLNAMLFSTMTDLQTVYLQNNYINNIPSGLFNVTSSLDTVDLSNNAIKSVSCSELSGRVKLYLNQITSLVNCSSYISYLDLRYNKLTSLSAMFFSESPIEIRLDLSHNNISSVHADAFLELSHLTTLTMSNNRITSIPAGTFRHLGGVTTLDISFNNLTHLEFGLFGGLTSLQVLDVSDNSIVMLEAKVLYPLKSLTKLNLNGNLLHTFDVDTMVSHMTRLESISLDRNQIWCEWLTNCIHVFTLRNIKVVTGDSFKTKNVHGIYCIARAIDVSVKVTQPLLQQPITRKSVAPTAAVVPTQNRVPSTRVFFFTEAPELVDVSTKHLVHTQTMEDHNDHAAVDYNKAEATRTEDEKSNEILKNMHSLLVFTAVAVIIIIILNLLFNMYFIKRNNIEIGRNSSSCAVELLNVTD